MLNYILAGLIIELVLGFFAVCRAPLQAPPELIDHMYVMWNWKGAWISLYHLAQFPSHSWIIWEWPGNDPVWLLASYFCCECFHMIITSVSVFKCAHIFRRGTAILTCGSKPLRNWKLSRRMNRYPLMFCLCSLLLVSNETFLHQELSLTLCRGCVCSVLMCCEMPSFFNVCSKKHESCWCTRLSLPLHRY